MNITIRPELEKKIGERAETEGISFEAYLEWLVQADNRATEELEAFALRAPFRRPHRSEARVLRREALADWTNA